MARRMQSRLVENSNYVQQSRSDRNGEGKPSLGLPPTISCSAAFLRRCRVRLNALKICRTSVAVLLLGEGGTGKEVLARWLHANSQHADGEFRSELRSDSGSCWRANYSGHEGRVYGHMPVSPDA